jgi:hypothetical protein
MREMMCEMRDKNIPLCFQGHPLAGTIHGTPMLLPWFAMLAENMRVPETMDRISNSCLGHPTPEHLIGGVLRHLIRRYLLYTRSSMITDNIDIIIILQLSYTSYHVYCAVHAC